MKHGHSMIIFGGTKGIGRMLAGYYRKNGFQVSVAARHPSSKDIKADVSDEKSVEAAFDRHFKRWGRGPDVVINCAALQGPIGNSWEIPVKKFEETLRINLLGGFIVARAAIKRMIAAGTGSIVMFSGGGAAYGRSHFNAYGASKTGILRMVETMAEELKEAGYPNIIINAVAPGGVKTRLTTDILKAGKIIGKKEREGASLVFQNGGTPPQEIFDLVDLLIDRKAAHALTGRLIHVRDNYGRIVKKYGKKVPDDMGKLRRIGFK